MAASGHWPEAQVPWKPAGGSKDPQELASERTPGPGAVQATRLKRRKGPHTVEELQFCGHI